MVTNGVLALCCIAVFGVGYLIGYISNEIGRREIKLVKSENAERCVCCGQVIPEGRQVCVICGYKADKKKTNYDRIRNMSVEELAKLINVIAVHCYGDNCKGCPIYDDIGVCNCNTENLKQWLETEVDTE